MSKRFLLYALFLLCGWVLMSCSDDDEVRIEINNLTVGSGVTPSVAAGGVFQISAGLVADAGIMNVRLVIEQSGADEVEEWAEDALYITGYSGKRSATFEEFITVPYYALPGTYRIWMILKDMQNEEVTVEGSISITAAPQ